MEIYDVYVDGSFSEERVKWAMVIVDGDSLIHEDAGILPKCLNEHGQIVGELNGAVLAVVWAYKNNCKVRIFYDYLGIEKWATGEWKANKEATQKYAEYMQKHAPKYVDSFVKVKSHSGDYWNDYVDELIRTHPNAQLKP